MKILKSKKFVGCLHRRPRTVEFVHAGAYELAPNFILTVTVEDGNLMTQATGQQKVRVYAESETKFFLKVTDAQIEFIKDDSGTVTGLKLYQAGRIVPAKKLKP